MIEYEDSFDEYLLDYKDHIVDELRMQTPPNPFILLLCEDGSSASESCGK